MTTTSLAERQMELLAEASDLPLRPEWLKDLSLRWAFFQDGIERLVAFSSDLPATGLEAEDEV